MTQSLIPARMSPRQEVQNVYPSAICGPSGVDGGLWVIYDPNNGGKIYGSDYHSEDRAWIDAMHRLPARMEAEERPTEFTKEERAKAWQDLHVRFNELPVPAERVWEIQATLNRLAASPVAQPITPVLGATPKPDAYAPPMSNAHSEAEGRTGIANIPTGATPVAPEVNTRVSPGVITVEANGKVLRVPDYDICYGECKDCGTTWTTREVVRECPICNLKAVPSAEPVAPHSVRNTYDSSKPLHDLEGWIVFYAQQAQRLENDHAMKEVYQASCETAALLLRLKEFAAEPVAPTYKETLQEVYDYFMGPEACGDFTCACNNPAICGICELRSRIQVVLAEPVAEDRTAAPCYPFDQMNLRNAARIVVEWFDGCRPDLIGPRINALREEIRKSDYMYPENPVPPDQSAAPELKGRPEKCPKCRRYHYTKGDDEFCERGGQLDPHVEPVPSPAQPAKEPK